MFIKRAMVFVVVVANLSLLSVEVRAVPTNDDFDVYDYPHQDDNWSYGLIESCQKEFSRGPFGGIHDWQWRSDGELREAVKCELESSPFIKSKGIEVSVENGTAILNGTVQDHDSIRSAIVDAYRAGVKDVVSQLQVEEEQ